VRIDLSREAVPDATTLLQFRHLLEEKDLTKAVFAAINAQLTAQGLMMREGTIADATIIPAPPSVKNEAKARDPEMHQTKKGNQWHFGMKAHIGVDAESGLVHTVVGTAANVADVAQTAEVLHGEEKVVHLDAGYTGVEKREDLKDRDIDWQVATKRSKLKAIPKESQLGTLLRRLESVKASIRSKVEHPFHALAAMEEGADAIARKVVALAKGGDMSAARLVIERLVPVAKERPIFLALPDTGSAEGIAEAQNAILQAVAAGDLLPGEAATLAGIVEARRKAVETQELEQRISALEEMK